ncbi:MAG: signal peptidase I [Deltaproteobacteria bacterium]|nr:signal peptidase I [Deltaproteobacteria bacterium]
MFRKRGGTARAEAKTLKKVAWEYLVTFGLALILALLIRASLVGAYEIPSGSMEPTLRIGDRFLANKFIYGLRVPFSDWVVVPLKQIQRGDIIVFEPPFDSPNPYIKRVIGLPGDVIEIVNKKVRLNGQPLKEPYAHFSDPRLLPPGLQPRDNFGPLTVPPGKLFVMGDNRDQSHDSRYWGFASQAQVQGKALVILWSWDSRSSSLRWPRLLSLVG